MVFACCLMAVLTSAQSAIRPKILGIDHVSFYTTDADGIKKVYGAVLGLESGEPIEAGAIQQYAIGYQWVGYSPAPDSKSTNRLDHAAFRTDDAAALKKYLDAEGIKTSELREGRDHTKVFSIADPEGHRIEFVQHTKAAPLVREAAAVSRHMIHVGFLVSNRDVEDKFYRDILGFHLYWQGGMREKTDWVAMQVPDGTDWLEYMLNQGDHPDQETSGVMNHISLGVKDMKQAQALLEAHGWKPHDQERAQMGKDGKWQLNIYDPDMTRIELMEFKPAQKPCCSEFKGPHPSE